MEPHFESSGVPGGPQGVLARTWERLWASLGVLRWSLSVPERLSSNARRHCGKPLWLREVSLTASERFCSVPCVTPRDPEDLSEEVPPEISQDAPGTSRGTPASPRTSQGDSRDQGPPASPRYPPDPRRPPRDALASPMYPQGLTQNHQDHTFVAITTTRA